MAIINVSLTQNMETVTNKKLNVGFANQAIRNENSNKPIERQTTIENRRADTPNTTPISPAPGGVPEPGVLDSGRQTQCVRLASFS